MNGPGAGERLALRDLLRLRAAAHGLELGARRLALSAQAGGYRSAWRGRGLEFDEARPYQPGDDVRSIDWRVTARRGRVHTKVFREERERPVLLMSDLHPGMYFGSRVQFKSVLAGRMTALMGWAAVRAGDRVGGLVRGAAGHREVSPMAREQGLLRLLRHMEDLQPTAPGAPRPGGMDPALARLARLARPGSLVAVFSDFLELGGAGERHLAALARHNDVILCLVHDRLEAAPPPPGAYELGDGSQRLRLNTGRPGVAEAWRDRFEAHRARVRGLCRRYRLHFMQADTHQAPLDALRHGLARHAGEAA